MDAIVIAGGIPQPGDPLYEYTQGAPKALLDIAGKPMIQWVLDALSAANSIDRIVIIGLPDPTAITCPKAAAFLSNQGDMVENIRSGVFKILEIDPQARHVLVASSDIPAVTSVMVDWLVQTAMQSDDDAYYTVISREVMETRFPGSKRSYTRLRDVELCGGDMNLIKTSLVTRHEQLWKQLIEARKNSLKQAALIGYDTLFLLLFRLVTLDQAVDKVARRLRITGRAILSPYAEIGMDVDKPFQLEILRADLAQRVSA